MSNIAQRSHVERTRSRARAPWLALLLLVLATATASAEPACSLDARNRSAVPLPQIEPGAMPATVAASLRHGYALVQLQYRYAEGERLLTSVLHSPAASSSDCVRALATFGIAQAIRSTRMGDALPLYRQAEALFRSIGAPMALAHVHQRIATTEYLLGDHAAYRRDDLSVPDEFSAAGDEASALAERSLALGLAETAPSPDEFQKLADALQALHTANVPGVRGGLEFQWADAYQQAGNLREGMSHDRAAVAALRECDCSLQTLGSAYLDMAQMTSKEDDQTAVLDYARKGDEVYRRAHLAPYRPRSLRILGTAYAQLGRHDLALATYQQALQLADRQHARHMIPGIVIMLAQAYGWADKPVAGIDLLERPDLQALSPWERCQYDASKAELQLDAHRYSDAQAISHHTLATCMDLFGILDKACIEYVVSQADMHMGQLEAALLHGQRAVEKIEEQRTLINTTDRNMNGFNESHSRYYDGLILVLLAMHRPEEALLISEQYRARPFLELVTSHLGEEARARPQVAALDLPGRPAPLPFYSEAHPFQLTSADIRRSVAESHSTLISYWLYRDRIYTWVLAPGQPAIAIDRPLPRATLDRLVRATLVGGPSEQRTWQQLYQLLIAPIEAHLPRQPGSLLTIVPQGSLFQLSFPALRDTHGRYLIERYAVHTVPAAGVLQVTARNEREAAALPPHYLLLASPERFPQVAGHPMPALPGAAAEVQDIARQLDRGDVTLLQGRQAGIDSLIDELPRATVLHLATHAVIDDDAPLRSFLALDRGQRGGMLTAGLVYGLHLNTSLVVLSACSTGRGKISGDGVSGLSRAFFYAGAASLVTTLWDVADEPTARLMPRFYAGLTRGETRSQALREAQLSLLDDLRHHRVKTAATSGAALSLPESPRYWAAFSLSGQP